MAMPKAHYRLNAEVTNFWNYCDQNSLSHNPVSNQTSCPALKLTIAFTGRWINEIVVAQEGNIKTFSRLSWV